MYLYCFYFTKKTMDPNNKRFHSRGLIIHIFITYSLSLIDVYSFKLNVNELLSNVSYVADEVISYVNSTL